MKMINGFKEKTEVEEILSALEKVQTEEYSFVDGKTYYEGCGVGFAFLYNGNECIEISSSQFEKVKDKFTKPYKFINASEIDSRFPISK